MKRLVYDILERAVWTFVQAALASIAVGSLFGLTAWKGAAVAGGASVLSLLKGVAASRLNVLQTASSLPAALDPVVGVAVEVATTAATTAVRNVGETAAGTVGELTEAGEAIAKQAAETATQTVTGVIGAVGGVTEGLLR